jgi:hypothetical protein
MPPYPDRMRLLPVGTDRSDVRRMLSIGPQTTYSRMKVEVVGGGERMWQGIMSRAMRLKNGECRWHHWARRTLPLFTLGNLGFAR